MTTQPPQPSWQWPAAQPSPTPPPTRKRWSTGRIILVVVGTIVGVFLLIGVIGALAGTEVATTRPATRATTPATQAPAAIEPVATDPPPTAPAYATPRARDFTLKVKVLEKQNFGSAGSLITYRIVADWSKSFDPDKTYEVTYEVRGGEDGPAINTFTVTGDEYQVEREESASTATVGARLSARVTSVEEA